ncbi:MAG TPA: SCO family protein [Pyrinomonadaceae bacterium]|nr:SCO family protein [Pyrinomonadaceae bacterium]
MMKRAAQHWVLTFTAILLVAFTSGTLIARGQSAVSRTVQPRASAVTYECPMHSEVTSKKRGKCPKCGMFLKARTRTSPVKTPTISEGPAAPRDSEIAGAGSDIASNSSVGARYFPNHVLITQDNEPVHFYDDLLMGKVALINFVFTTCQGVCSPMTANLARVQNYLSEQMGHQVVMISISVDPFMDTPERLKAYADKFKVKPGWYFLTGKKENVEWVLYKLGGYVEDKATHKSVLIVGNEATGEWMKIHAMANPTEIATAVRKLLAPKAVKDGN